MHSKQHDRNLIDGLWRIAGLCAPTPTVMFLTVTDWSELAETILRVQPGASDKPTPSNFKELKIGCLTVVNSGTDDKETVWHANQAAADNSHFAFKRDNFISGKD